MAVTLPRAVILGDSQLEGLAPHLRDALGDQMTIVGVAPMPGASTRVVVDSGKIHSYVASQHPDLVIFVLGGNDTAGAAAHQAVIDAVHQAQAGGAEVVWFGPAQAADPETDQRHAGTRAMQAALVPALGARWIDTSPWTSEGWGPDGVHFTTEAYAQQARAIAQALRPGMSPFAKAVLAVAGGGVLLGATALAIHAARERE